MSIDDLTPKEILQIKQTPELVLFWMRVFELRVGHFQNVRTLGGRGDGDTIAASAAKDADCSIKEFLRRFA